MTPVGWVMDEVFRIRVMIVGVSCLSVANWNGKPRIYRPNLADEIDD